MPWSADDAAPASGPVRGLHVGISGAPDSTPRPGSAHAIARCRELGLDALEMAWVHGVSIREASAAAVRAASERLGVRLSVHAPYYINLNSPDQTTREASRDRALSAARALQRHSSLEAREIVREALKIAGEICVYTNQDIMVLELPGGQG